MALDSKLPAATFAMASLLTLGLILSACSGQRKPNSPQPAPQPLAVVLLDSLRMPLASMPTFEVDVRLSYRQNDTDSIPSVDDISITIAYDESALNFLDVSSGPELERWEYFTWRRNPPPCPTCDEPQTVRIIAIKDLNNGPEPNLAKRRPSGVVARLRFYPRPSFAMNKACTSLRFYSNSLEANSLGNDAGFEYLPDGEMGGIEFGPDYNLADCEDSMPICVTGVQFVAGQVCGSEPGEWETGDLDLDGRPYRQGDAELLERFFLEGHSVWDDNPALAAQQVALSDVNRDGDALTVSDLEWIERYRRGTIGSGDTGFASIADTAIVLVGTQAKHFVTLIQTDTPVSAMWLLLSHPDQDSLVPEWVPEDPSLPSIRPSIEYRTDRRITRILVTNWSGYEVIGTDRDPLEFPIVFDRNANSRIILEAAQASAYPGRILNLQTGVVHLP